MKFLAVLLFLVTFSTFSHAESLIVGEWCSSPEHPRQYIFHSNGEFSLSGSFHGHQLNQGGLWSAKDDNNGALKFNREDSLYMEMLYSITEDGLYIYSDHNIHNYLEASKAWQPCESFVGM